MIRHDLRHAFRTVSRAPRFTALAAGVLALGLGLNATVFTVVNAVLFKGLPGVTDSERIVYIGTQKDGRGCCVSYPDLLDWRAQLTTIGSLGAAADQRITLTDERGLTDATTASRITANAFRVLGYRPAIGRDFTADDERSGAPPVAILSDRFWERRYGRDQSVLGRVIRINGTQTTVVGVMGHGVGFPQNQDLWMWLASSMGTFWRSRINAILLLTLGSSALLLAAMGLYAVLACAVGRRTHEIAVRMAIGGSRRDVVALVVRDGLRDVLAGVVVGVAVSVAMMRLASGWVPNLAEVGLAVHIVAIAVVLAASLLACIAPARRATRVDPMAALRDA